MTVKDDLHRLADALSEDQAMEALDYLNWKLAETDTLTSDEPDAVEAGEAELARGEFVTLDELKRDLRL